MRPTKLTESQERSIRLPVPAGDGFVSMRRSQVQYHSEGSKLRRLARSDEVEIAFTLHAQKELAKDDILRQDALAVLRSGCIESSEFYGNEWRRRVRGRDCEGEEITLVVTVDYGIDRIVVITGWKTRS